MPAIASGCSVCNMSALMPPISIAGRVAMHQTHGNGLRARTTQGHLAWRAVLVERRCSDNGYHTVGEAMRLIQEVLAHTMRSRPPCR